MFVTEKELAEMPLDEVEETTSEGFRIDDDGKADWAVQKVLDAYEERDRLLELIKLKRSELDAKEEQVLRECGTKTEYLLSLLHDYMGEVKAKETATQRSYKLLSGTIVCKKPKVDVAAGDGLCDWLSDNRPDLIKIDKKPDWAAVKKMIVRVGDGCFALSDTGEILDGIVEKEIPGKIEVKR